MTNSVNSKKNKEGKTALTEREVLKVAAGLIRIHGYHGTSTQMIADELGISKSTLFHHIKNKQQMLYKIFSDPLRKIYPDLKEVYSKDLPSTEKLESVVKNHVTSLVDNIEVVAVLLHERNYLKPPYSEELEPVRDEYVRTIRLIIEEGVKNGEFRKVDPKITTFAILGMCNWLVQWYNPEGDVSISEIADMYTDYAMQLVRP